MRYLLVKATNGFALARNDGRALATYTAHCGGTFDASWRPEVWPTKEAAVAFARTQGWQPCEDNNERGSHS